MPKISAAMPAYNSEQTIGRAIEAVLAQEFEDWELIVVNDASTDKTLKIANEYAQKDKRIKVFSNKENQGFSYSRDRTIKESSGEIIVVADSDDLSYPTRFSTVAKAYEVDPELEIFYTNVDYFYTESGEIKRRFFQPFNKELLKHINYIPDPGASFKKSLYNELGGYDFEIKIGADYDLWLRAAKTGKKIGCSDKSLVQYRKSGNSLTANPTSPENIEKRQHWNKVVREKNQIFSVDPDYVRKNAAAADVVDFYVNKNYEIWFGKESIPKTL